MHKYLLSATGSNVLFRIDQALQEWSTTNLSVQDGLYEFSQNSGSAKCVLKREILKIQKGGDPIEWQHGTWNTLEYLRY